MAFGVLQRLKDAVWSNGAELTPEADVGTPRFQPWEIDLLKQQIARANADARAELDRRGHRGLNPRILAARAEGAKV